MKKIALAAAMALALGGTAQADLFDYAELQAGATLAPDLGTNGVDNEMDAGFNVGGALGWNLTPEFALEADVFFTQSGFEGPLTTDASLKSFTFMANLLYAFDMESTNWRPHIGAGLGGAQVTVTDGTFGATPFTGDSEIVFAWQAMAGISVPVADRIDVLIEYRYQGASDADLVVTNGVGVGLPISQEYQSHNISVGFHFTM